MTTYDEWHKANTKYMQPADIDAWCEAAWNAAIELRQENERLTLEVKRYESRGNQYLELRTQLQEAQAERDLHYNRCASLLFSDALCDTTAGDIRKWVAEYVDAKADWTAMNKELKHVITERDAAQANAARYRAALVGLMACTLRADVPADIYDAAEKALKGDV